MKNGKRRCRGGGLQRAIREEEQVLRYALICQWSTRQYGHLSVGRYRHMRLHGRVPCDARLYYDALRERNRADALSERLRGRLNTSRISVATFDELMQVLLHVGSQQGEDELLSEAEALYG